MTQNENGTDWATHLAAAIGSQVARLRREAGLSAEDLSRRTHQLGYPLARSVIANLENGRRGVVGVADVYALAAALGVPPVSLLLPAPPDGGLEVVPGVDMPTYDAALWLTGTFPLPMTATPWDTTPAELAGARLRFQRTAGPLRETLEILDLSRELRRAAEELRACMGDPGSRARPGAIWGQSSGRTRYTVARTRFEGLYFLWNRPSLWGSLGLDAVPLQDRLFNPDQYADVLQEIRRTDWPGDDDNDHNERTD